MKPEVRIRTNLPLAVAYTWPPRKAPKSIKPRSKRCEELQEKLNNDPREFFIRAAFNGL
jgi:hypothetical protein